MQDYTLEYLEQKFKEHEEQWKQSIIENEAKYKAMFPNDEYVVDDFCLCRALLVLTKELKRIKEMYVW